MIKIIKKQHPITTFDSLCIGDYFDYSGDICIKTDKGWYNFNTQSHSTERNDYKWEVTPIKVKFNFKLKTQCHNRFSDIKDGEMFIYDMQKYIKLSLNTSVYNSYNLSSEDFTHFSNSETLVERETKKEKYIEMKIGTTFVFDNCVYLKLNNNKKDSCLTLVNPFSNKYLIPGYLTFFSSDIELEIVDNVELIVEN